LKKPKALCIFLVNQEKEDDYGHFNTA